MKFYRNKLAAVRNVHSKFQVFRTSGSLFLYCKILQNWNFLYLFELDCHKNQYNDMKSYMDNLTGMENPHAKFQVSGSSGSMFLYCKIMQDSDFFTFFWAWLLQKSGHWHEFLQGQTRGEGTYIPNFKSPGHQEVCFYTVKYCKIAISWSFLSLAATKINTMTWNYTWTN